MVQLKSMRKIVDEEIACDESTPLPMDETSSSPDDNAELIFGGVESPSISVEELSPSPTHIVQLWQIYLDRVNPLTKIIHVPTVGPYLLQATGASPQLPKNVEALLFSIYTLATVAMSKEECEEILGMPRDKALARFGQGVRLSLTQMGFLKTHDLLTLQALVIYLVSQPVPHCVLFVYESLNSSRSRFKADTIAMPLGFSMVSSFVSRRRWVFIAMVNSWA